MTEPFRWGIIGTGRIARAFAADLNVSGDGRVVAIGSRTLSSANSFADQFDVKQRYGSYEELVRDEAVDAIYVATPHPMHRDNALLALEHDKHVLVEKAFTMNGAEAREVVACARDRGLFLMEAMWTRFLPHVLALRDLIAQGALGPIVSVEADHGQYFESDPESRLFKRELGGGALLDLGVYPVSFASMILGTPTRIRTLVDPAFTGVDGQTSMLFGYESGAHSVLTCTSRARSATRACVTGEKARHRNRRAFLCSDFFFIDSKEWNYPTFRIRDSRPRHAV